MNDFLEKIVLDELEKISKDLDTLHHDYKNGEIDTNEYGKQTQRLIEIQRPLQKVLIKYKPKVYG